MLIPSPLRTSNLTNIYIFHKLLILYSTDQNIRVYIDKIFGVNDLYENEITR